MRISISKRSSSVACTDVTTILITWRDLIETQTKQQRKVKKLEIKVSGKLEESVSHAVGSAAN